MGINVFLCLLQNGETPLHFAAQLGYLDIVEYLATGGAQIDATDHVSLLVILSVDKTRNY